MQTPVAFKDLVVGRHYLISIFRDEGKLSPAQLTVIDPKFGSPEEILFRNLPGVLIKKQTQVPNYTPATHTRFAANRVTVEMDNHHPDYKHAISTTFDQTLFFPASEIERRKSEAVQQSVSKATGLALHNPATTNILKMAGLPIPQPRKDTLIGGPTNFSDADKALRHGELGGKRRKTRRRKHKKSRKLSLRHHQIH